MIDDVTSKNFSSILQNRSLRFLDENVESFILVIVFSTINSIFDFSSISLIWRSKILRSKAANIFIVASLISDFLNNIGYTIVAIFDLISWRNRQPVILEKRTCYNYIFILSFTYEASAKFLMAAAFDRYLAKNYRKLYEKFACRLGKYEIGVTIKILTTECIVVASSFFLPLTGEFLVACSLRTTTSHVPVRIVFDFVLHASPLVILTLFYWKKFFGQKNQVSTNQNDHQSVDKIPLALILIILSRFFLHLTDYFQSRENPTNELLDLYRINLGLIVFLSYTLFVPDFLTAFSKNPFSPTTE
uniref:G-protein coupled receptors family 1 profile domain-containing protein n=1 Tax=Romanomermis culicivorax TaxID=13658 RepID=A0A915I7T3_ROMCU